LHSQTEKNTNKIDLFWQRKKKRQTTREFEKLCSKKTFNDEVQNENLLGK